MMICVTTVMKTAFIVTAIVAANVAFVVGSGKPHPSIHPAAMGRHQSRTKRPGSSTMYQSAGNQ
jgi:hypothetical protein